MIWDERWRPEKPRLARLDQAARVRFAAACVDRAVWRLAPLLEPTMVGGKLPAVRAGLELLWRIAEAKTPGAVPPEQLEQAIRALEALEPDEDSPELEVHGWDDLLY